MEKGNKDKTSYDVRDIQVVLKYIGENSVFSLVHSPYFVFLKTSNAVVHTQL